MEIMRLDLMQEGSMVLVVRSEEEKVETERAVQEAVVHQWRSKFALEIEGE